MSYNILPNCAGLFSKFPIQQIMQLLEDLSMLDRCIYSIFDFENATDAHHTSNFNKVQDLNSITNCIKWNDFYPSLLADKLPAMKYVSLLKNIIDRYTKNELKYLYGICCGYFIQKEDGSFFRGLYRAHPITIDESSGIKFSFDKLSNVGDLMISEKGYWIRFSVGEKVFHWHSHTNKFVQKEILTPREIEIIHLWRDGYSISKIALKLYVSCYTVKNQLANARQKLLARDNTSLVQLCLRTGILSPEF